MSVGLAAVRSVQIVAKIGSLSAAADVLNISQPALSRRITQAESALGVALFERLPRGLRPTDACLAFLHYAETALASIDDAHEAVLEFKASGGQTLSIAFVEAVCDAWLMRAVREVMAELPSLAPVLRPWTVSSDVSADVLEGRVKLGVRYRHDDNPKLGSALVLEDRVAVVCAPDHPLAAKRQADLEALARQQWLGYPVRSGTGGSFNDILASRGFGAWRIIPLDSAHAQEQLVLGGFGIALMRHASIARRLAEGALVEIDTPMSNTVPVYLIWRRSAHLGVAAERLRDKLRLAAPNPSAVCS
jgi:DNA-binding transcriptional LysR family regulator